MVCPAARAHLARASRTSAVASRRRSRWTADADAQAWCAPPSAARRARSHAPAAARRARRRCCAHRARASRASRDAGAGVLRSTPAGRGGAGRPRARPLRRRPRRGGGRRPRRPIRRAAAVDFAVRGGGGDARGEGRGRGRRRRRGDVVRARAPPQRGRGGVGGLDAAAPSARVLGSLLRRILRRSILVSRPEDDPGDPGDARRVGLSRGPFFVVRGIGGIGRGAIVGARGASRESTAPAVWRPRASRAAAPSAACDETTRLELATQRAVATLARGDAANADGLTPPRPSRRARASERSSRRSKRRRRRRRERHVLATSRDGHAHGSSGRGGGGRAGDGAQQNRRQNNRRRRRPSALGTRPRRSSARSRWGSVHAREGRSGAAAGAGAAAKALRALFARGDAAADGGSASRPPRGAGADAADGDANDAGSVSVRGGARASPGDGARRRRLGRGAARASSGRWRRR